RRGRTQSFEPLVVEHASMHVVCPRLCDDVHAAARRPSKFRVRAARNYLEFFYGIQRNVDGRALTSHLFAEEAVVVIAAIQADVVENSALSVEVDLIPVGPLHDAHTRSEGQ